MTYKELLKASVMRISLTSYSPALDAEVLLAHTIGETRSWLLAHLELRPSPEHLASFEAGIEKLAEGAPLPYVLGHWEFYGLDFEVTPDVLIPRPETEFLVDKALEWLKHHPGSRRAIDVGTGSGCIAATLASRTPDLQLVATDVSTPALAVAKRNAVKLGVAEKINFIECDLFPTTTQQPGFDLIVGNLPYIPTQTVKSLKIYGKEPIIALDGGEDGLDLIRRLLTLSRHHIIRGGLILLEIEANQGIAALSLAYDMATHATIHLYQDLAGHDRLLEIQTHEANGLE
jgi:release factor glutamine methyltransferase